MYIETELQLTLAITLAAGIVIAYSVMGGLLADVTATWSGAHIADYRPVDYPFHGGGDRTPSLEIARNLGHMYDRGIRAVSQSRRRMGGRCYAAYLHGRLVRGATFLFSISYTPTLLALVAAFAAYWIASSIRGQQGPVSVD